MKLTLNLESEPTKSKTLIVKKKSEKDSFT